MTLEPEDVQGLKHYGVNGMHWGTRKGKIMTEAVNKSQGTGYKSGFRAAGKMTKNVVDHPLTSAKVLIKNNYAHPIMSMTSPVTMAKKNNFDIDYNVQAQGKRKKELQYFTKELKETKPKVKDLRKVQKKEGNTYYNYMRYNDTNDYLNAVRKKIKKIRRTPTTISKAVIKQSSLSRERDNAMTLESEDVQGLKHYGVKGQKWGARHAYRKAISRAAHHDSRANNYADISRDHADAAKKLRFVASSTMVSKKEADRFNRDAAYREELARSIMKISNAERVKARSFIKTAADTKLTGYPTPKKDAAKAIISGIAYPIFGTAFYLNRQAKLQKSVDASNKLQKRKV